MMCVTIFVLFNTDFRVCFFDYVSDPSFEVLNAIAFFLFLLELLLKSWAETEFFQVRPDGAGKKKRVFKPRGYFGSFFFILDLIALWSIIFEVKWLEEGTGLNFIRGQDSSMTLKAGRIVRMIRLVRLVKIYKIASQRRREKKILDDLCNLVDQGRMGAEEIDSYFHKMQHQKQSKVGSDLVDMITRKVIICVLSMLVMVPVLTVEEKGLHFKHSVQLLGEYIEPGRTCQEVELAVDTFINSTLLVGHNVMGGDSFESSAYHLLNLKVDGFENCDIDGYIDRGLSNSWDNMPPQYGSQFSDQRSLVLAGNEREEFLTTIDCDAGNCMAVFSIKESARHGALLSIYLTLFVIAILVSMAVAFESDAQKLVLSPIEQMMEMINMVADSPLVEFDFSEEIGSGRGGGGGGGGGGGSAHTTGEYELKVVAMAIQKITSLLRIGFGVAGAEIISKNMSLETGEASSVLDPMIPGKRMYSIFGFCDIHEFDMCTEALEDEIMTFVNSVARIVHHQVTRWGGTCNKNLGNAFLMIWRIGDEDELLSGSKRRKLPAGRPREGRDVEVDLRRIPGVDTLSDKALYGFLKVIVEINRDHAVLAYRSDERLRQHENGFKLRMGFGLHAGWAIEGAVGSLQKVDATYLSPHVNMAARMEAASRQFGVSVLMTEKFHELMSNEAQSYCRRLDIVTVKGSAVPMPIYTYDTFQNQSFKDSRASEVADGKSLSSKITIEDNHADCDWATDQDLVDLRKLATPDFNVKFRDGINSYLGGNWAKAKTLLEDCDLMMSESDIGGDGPSQTILNYMKNRDWECPESWQGYRPLTSK